MTVSVCLWLQLACQLVLRGLEGAARAVGGAGTAWNAKTATRVTGEMARSKQEQRDPGGGATLVQSSSSLWQLTAVTLHERLMPPTARAERPNAY